MIHLLLLSVTEERSNLWNIVARHRPVKRLYNYAFGCLSSCWRNQHCHVAANACMCTARYSGGTWQLMSHDGMCRNKYVHVLVVLLSAQLNQMVMTCHMSAAMCITVDASDHERYFAMSLNCWGLTSPCCCHNIAVVRQLSCMHCSSPC